VNPSTASAPSPNPVEGSLGFVQRPVKPQHAVVRGWNEVRAWLAETVAPTRRRWLRVRCHLAERLHPTGEILPPGLHCLAITLQEAAYSRDVSAEWARRRGLSDVEVEKRRGAVSRMHILIHDGDATGISAREEAELDLIILNGRLVKNVAGPCWRIEPPRIPITPVATAPRTEVAA
jgi:hypothetical protein